MKIMPLVPLAGLLFAAVFGGAHAKPPTLDPTYGTPLLAAKAPTAPVSQASWIWAGETKDKETIYLRRSFSLLAVPKTATLYLTADNFFTLFVNGKEVDHSQADPQDTNVWQHVHRIDLAPFLLAGKNTLAVRAVNSGGAAGVVARLEVPGQSPLETDGRWKVSAEALATDDWAASDFDDSAWVAATLVAPLTGGVWSGVGGLQGWPGYDTNVPYLAHIALPFAKILNLKPGAKAIAGADRLPGRLGAVLTVTPAAAGTADAPSLTLDFGQEIAGRVLLEGLTPGTVVAGTGESLEEAEKSPWTGTHSLLLAPGEKAYTPYSAFRYVHLVFPASAGNSQPLKLRVTMDHKYYPVQYQGAFDCSDPLLTKLWYTGAYTAHLCMQEDIWDAPKRDRARWIGDLHVSGRVIDTVFADKFLMEQTMQRLRDEAQGGQPSEALPKMHVNGIPGYSCAWICTLADFHKHLADYSYLNRQHQALLTLLEYLQGELDDNNLFADKRGQWPFVDWSPGFDGNTPQARAATQMFYVQAAHDAVYLLSEMGDKANAAKYSAWGETLTQAARSSLVDGKANTYGDRLQENAMAVYSGVATPKQQQAIYAAVLNPDSPAWDKTGTPPYNNGVISPYYNNYVIYAMSRTGHTADTLRVLRDYWGAMLAEGATTCWEAYDPHWPKADFHANLYADGNHGYFVSLCHGWSAGPTSWLTERVLGVRPTGAGYRTAEIAPNLGDLSWAEGDVPTPHGPIHVHAEKAENGLAVQVTLPAGVDAQVRLTGRIVRLNHAGTYKLTP